MENVKKFYFILPFLILVLVFGFGLTTSCKAKEIIQEEKIVEEPAEEEIVDIKEEETITETNFEESPIVDMEKVKFWEAIVDGEKNYDITDKFLEYPMEEINILSDFIDGEITYDEQITRFWELANKVQKDFSFAEIMIKASLKEKEVTADEDMLNIINLIVEWAEKTGDSYSYYAKYLDTDQAEYDFKVDELKEEVDDIHQEYLELRYPFIKDYNTYKGIE